MLTPPNLFDEYKLIMEDTARLAERRYSVTNGYIAANLSLLVGLAALLASDKLTLFLKSGLLLGLSMTGIALNYYWYRFLDMIALFTSQVIVPDQPLRPLPGLIV